jgi:hypothetical protein
MLNRGDKRIAFSLSKLVKLVTERRLALKLQSFNKKVASAFLLCIQSSEQEEWDGVVLTSMKIQIESSPSSAFPSSSSSVWVVFP